MFKLLLTAALGAVLLLTGCRSTSVVPHVPVDTDQVVFQVDTAGGFVPRIEAEAHVPELTVFGNGRVLYVRQDQDGVRRVVETRLPETKLRELLDLAVRSMAGLKESYEWEGVADASTTRFALLTAEGTQNVSVYAFDLDPDQRARDQTVMNKLRAVRAAFTAALPDQAPVYRPESVQLIAEMVPPGEYDAPVLDWPAGLPDLPVGTGAGETVKETHSGETAQKLVKEVPYRTFGFYRSEERLFIVAVKPDVPVLR